MLAYLLAIGVGMGSFLLYMAAFFFPEVHRKYDLIWSGVGMFYALVLWVCAGRITGGVLLGQTASVALLGWFGWQTLQLRRSQTPLAQQTQLPGEAQSVGEVMQLQMATLKEKFQQSDAEQTLSGLVAQTQQVIKAAISGLQSRLTRSVKSTSASPRSSPTSVPSIPPDAEWLEADVIGLEDEADRPPANARESSVPFAERPSQPASTSAEPTFADLPPRSEDPSQVEPESNDSLFDPPSNSLEE